MLGHCLKEKNSNVKLFRGYDNGQVSFVATYKTDEHVNEKLNQMMIWKETLVVKNNGHQKI